jgi:hypothetical protein
MMKVKKKILCPQRLRRMPGQFSWIDQRLVREGYLQRCDHGALALYLVLVTVADAEGLSYYSEGRLERLLQREHVPLLRARPQLCQADLIGYQAPLYQVLALDSPQEASGVREPATRGGPARPLADILRQVPGGAA